MQIIERTRLLDRERFEANRRFEEMTDIAERLSYPIDTTIDYELRGDAVYACTDTVMRPFHNQTLQALLAGEQQYGGDQQFQRERLRLEHEEALTVDRLARGELEGDILVKYSKVPDAVVEDRTSINGYRRDLLRSFVRIYYKTDSGVTCRLFTLDHNHPEAVQRVGQLIGIDTTRPSEAVLADSALYRCEDEDPATITDQLASRIIELYDATVFKATGIETHAGSMYLSKQEAMSVIANHSQLVSQHMDAIARIMAHGRQEEALERERRKTAAAIKLAAEGHDITSTGDASVAVEAAQGNYGGDCPTANGMNQAQTMENIWSHGECQVCFVKTQVGSCRVCARCAAADDRGIDLLKLREANLKKRQTSTRLAARSFELSSDSPQTRKPSQHEQVKRAYGQHAVVHTEVVIGGVHRYAKDKRTGALLAKL